MPSQPRNHLFDVATADNTAVVRLNNLSLDDANIRTLAEHLARLVDESGRRRVRVDLGDVDSVGSTGLATFVALHQKLQSVGGQLTLCNADTFVYEIFEITRLNELLDVRRKEAG
ncbi:MAG TPA: STAS domain-containing protein [Gemmataceae bacterium]|jgi:anti-anti-sigma factor|nr:STAS domain-containing protein [Gemmataceae bacterium]